MTKTTVTFLPIVIVNPIRAVAVTAAIEAARRTVAHPRRAPVVCQTPGEGPPAIEDQSDVERAIKSLCRSIGAQDAAVCIIASFADPGLYLARIATPVLGGAECGILMALTLG